MKKSIDEKLKSRLNKLRELAERGVGGERQSAQKKLEELLEHNNITISDLRQEDIKFYLFSYTDSFTEKLLSQCIVKILGIDAQFYKVKRTRNKLGIYCTPAQKVEIDLDYDFYSHLFFEEVDILLTAFIQKQDIFPPDSVAKDMSTLTESELKKFKKALMMGQNIEKQRRSAGLIEDGTNLRS